MALVGNISAKQRPVAPRGCPALSEHRQAGQVREVSVNRGHLRQKGSQNDGDVRLMEDTSVTVGTESLSDDSDVNDFIVN